MKPQPIRIDGNSNRANLLLLISSDPREHTAALEGIRCAMGLFSDTRWNVRVGFCEGAAGFAVGLLDDPSNESIHDNVIIREWIGSGCAWFCLASGNVNAQYKDGKVQVNMLNPAQWLRLAMAQSHILMFGKGRVRTG